jgi:hypothetical protein
MMSSAPVNTTLPLVVSIVSILCCGIGLVGGVVGLIFSIQARSAVDQGQIEDARGKAKIGLLVPAICGGLQLVLWIIYWLVAFVMVAASE